MRDKLAWAAACDLHKAKELLFFRLLVCLLLFFRLPYAITSIVTLHRTVPTLHELCRRCRTAGRVSTETTASSSTLRHRRGSEVSDAPLRLDSRRKFRFVQSAHGNLGDGQKGNNGR